MTLQVVFTALYSYVCVNCTVPPPRGIFVWHSIYHTPKTTKPQALLLFMVYTVEVFIVFSVDLYLAVYRKNR